MKSFFSHTTYTADEPELSARDKDEKRLLNDLKLTRAELEIAYSGFDNVTDPDLIDCYIYKVNAVLKRYKFLMEQAEKLNLPPDSGIKDSLCEKAPATSSFV